MIGKQWNSQSLRKMSTLYIGKIVKYSFLKKKTNAL